MKYFKNTELAKLYHVSEKSVRNWIEAAEAGKLDLQLFDKNSKKFIANTSKNTVLIEKQVEKGKKFKNTRGLRTIAPSKEFYQIYNREQIVDMVTNITIHKEIPLQYGYLNGGADSWDDYAKRLVNEEASNILKNTVELLDLQGQYLDRIVGDERKVNVIDLGPGNGLPLRSTLARLVEQGRLDRYIAIDVSKDMLAILRKNIDEWFEGKVKIETHVRNFAEERFDDLLIEDRIHKDTPANLVFLLGGTVSNMRLPEHTLRVINNSLAPDDVVMCSGYLDTPYMRRYFDLSGSAVSAQKPDQAAPRFVKPGVRMMVPSLLRIDEQLCEYEVAFSESHQSRIQWLKPKVDLLLQLELGAETWEIELRKDDPILVWRHRHFTLPGIIDFFDKNDFAVTQASKSTDGNYFLVASKIKPGIVEI